MGEAVKKEFTEKTEKKLLDQIDYIMNVSRNQYEKSVFSAGTVDDTRKESLKHCLSIFYRQALTKNICARDRSITNKDVLDVISTNVESMIATNIGTIRVNWDLSIMGIVIGASYQSREASNDHPEGYPTTDNIAEIFGGNDKWIDYKYDLQHWFTPLKYTDLKKNAFIEVRYHFKVLTFKRDEDTDNRIRSYITTVDAKTSRFRPMDPFVFMQQAIIKADKLSVYPKKEN